MPNPVKATRLRTNPSSRRRPDANAASSRNVPPPPNPRSRRTVSTAAAAAAAEDEDARVEEPAVDDDDEIEAEDVDADVPVPNEDRPEPPVEPVDAGSRKVTQRSRLARRPGRNRSRSAPRASSDSPRAPPPPGTSPPRAPPRSPPPPPRRPRSTSRTRIDALRRRVRRRHRTRRGRASAGAPPPPPVPDHRARAPPGDEADRVGVGFGRRTIRRGGPGECVVCVWDASTGACLRELVHSRAGGCVVSLQFSPEGALLLSAGADPDGALRVWDVATGARVLAAAADAPVAAAGWCTHLACARAEFFTAGRTARGCTRCRTRPGRRGRTPSPKSRSTTTTIITTTTIEPRMRRGSLKRGFTGASPVCTAACVASDGSLFVGDSRGRACGGLPCGSASRRTGARCRRWPSVATPCPPARRSPPFARCPAGGCSWAERGARGFGSTR